MKSSHLTMLLFCNVLLAPLIFYFASLAVASPLSPLEGPSPTKPKDSPQVSGAAAVAAASAPASKQMISGKSSSQEPDQQVARKVKASEPQASVVSARQQSQVVAEVPKEQKGVEGRKESPAVQQQYKKQAQMAPKAEDAKMEAKGAPGVPVVAPSQQQPKQVAAPQVATVEQRLPVPVVVAAVPAAAPAIPQPAALTSETAPVPRRVGVPAASIEEKEKPIVVKEEKPVAAAGQYVTVGGRANEAPAPKLSGAEQQAFDASKQQVAPVAAQSPPAALEFAAPQSAPAAQQSGSPVVMGGLGPLHLLATTLCSYQPDKLVADENLNQLYCRRATLRKSLLEFMSLKFTNLEKLSSKLGDGLQVVPVRKTPEASSPAKSSSSTGPSHGWPVVGRCTAHDLMLMGEAAWCECDSESGCSPNANAQASAQAAAAAAPAAPVGPEQTVVAAAASPLIAILPELGAPSEPQAIASGKAAAPVGNKPARVSAARSLGQVSLTPTEQSAVISKMLHVADVKDAPIVESSIYNLNLTQQQLATLEAHATSTRECRRNALRYTKVLFHHLAEDQSQPSTSWPKLYEVINADDCVRKRMIDIVTALSTFRTDTTSIRRDNLEFAFAMDDLRAKVLESEVNVPLTFDKQFIEVEQFLQQSVRLMLSNIDPNRAKLTSMRYRSLMFGSAASDDQCIELHQRLLSRNYPTDCNPNQFGQLADVLRMTAMSLELWSIDKELSLYSAKHVDSPNSNSPSPQKVEENVNECIANMVAS